MNSLRFRKAWIRSICFGLFLSFAVGPTLAAAPGFGKAQWIWDSLTPGAGNTVYFRKTFVAPHKIDSAKLLITCDNRLQAYLNGSLVGKSSQWEKPIFVDVTSKLSPDKNILAIQGINEGGQAGLIAHLQIKTKDGSTHSIVTGKDWKQTRRESKDWFKATFDDKNWKPSHAFGDSSVSPWSQTIANAVSQLKSPGRNVQIHKDLVNALEGFQVEMIYRVPRQSQGSWVSMTTDSKGRLICSDQYGGLFRITPGETAEQTKVEALDAKIGDAQGLLYALGSLYVTVNGRAAQGSGFYRLRDTNGDDQFDEVRLLKKFQGGGEHGPHGIRLGRDGMLYVIAGNATQIPDGITKTSPHRNWKEDLLLPRNPDGRGHATGRLAPGGWIARTDKDGKQWELLCAGFRNPYDIAFNKDNELFTYDADMEWDTGVSWYRPTRVNHAVAGAEYGWRFGTGKWPAYYPDSVGAVVNIGLGSPTGIEFGYGAKFPEKYQNALFINDWTYGVIYAVHLEPAGATYTGKFERFISGKPLPVTDIVVNPVDGAMYFTVGGRRTQSALYRVTYNGKQTEKSPVPSQLDEKAEQARQRREQRIAKSAAARKLRHAIEARMGKQDPTTVAFVWPHLNSHDRALRYAARIALEHQPLSQWNEKALAEQKINASIQALLALTRTADAAAQDDVLTALARLPLERMSEEQLLDTLRVYQLAFIRLGGKTASAKDVLKLLDPLFPHESNLVNHELCRLLVYLEAPQISKRAMQLVAEARTQEEQWFYIFVLRNLRTGWTLDERKAYFSWMNQADKKYSGGASFKLFLKRAREDAIKHLSEEDRVAIQDILAGNKSSEVITLDKSRQFIHNWQMDDVRELVDQVDRGRSFEKGKLAYQAAQCAKCHRFAGQGAATGPDVTGVGNRFSPLYLLESLIEPSKVISDQYRNSIIITEQGEIITGRIIDETPTHLNIRTSPFAKELTKIAKKDIEEQLASQNSEMPTGLINVLTKEEILDLIAYLRSGGNPQDPAFEK